jgi:hypothetical protein
MIFTSPGQVRITEATFYLFYIASEERKILLVVITFLFNNVS